MREDPPPTIDLHLAVAAVRQVMPPKRRDSVSLNADTQLEDIGLSSLDVGEVFVRLEALAGIRLDTSRMEEARTIGDLLKVEPASAERAW